MITTRSDRMNERNREIYELHKSDRKMTVRKLAKMYGLHPSRIGQILQDEREIVEAEKAEQAYHGPVFVAKRLGKKV